MCWTVHRLQRGGSEGILQEVRRTWPLLSPTARPERGVSLAILTEVDVEMLVDGVVGGREVGSQKFEGGILCVRFAWGLWVTWRLRLGNLCWARASLAVM